MVKVPSVSRTQQAARFLFPLHILTFLEDKLGTKAVESMQVEEIQSAQQRVLVLQFLGDNDNVADDDWKDALRAGRNHLVVRIWKGGKRWFNLNHCCSSSSGSSHGTNSNAQLEAIAAHEVWGYQSARQALMVDSRSRTASNKNLVRIPAVLYFSSAAPSPGEAAHHEPPWAIFEYVGAQSTLFDDGRRLDDSWTTGMTKVREEFGFSEPHPRWGRVPVEGALEYALTVLHNAILPWQRNFDGRQQHNAMHPSSAIPKHCYSDMVQLYREKLGTFIMKSDEEEDKRDSALQTAISKLAAAIERLEKEATETDSLKPLPPVLCHMDCQPQNVLFARNSSDADATSAVLVSVLDWEEATYADPRFELLMLCRRVCANRSQADRVWQTYQEEMNVPLGSIEPWLKLETVHSITTLLLQATAGGGRSPWETKHDLRRKIEREFHRLEAVGWTFCVGNNKSVP